MKVFNLRCGYGHSFEGWFATEEDFQNQSERGILECPMCSSADVVRMPSAPRLNLGASPAERAATAMSEDIQAAWLRLARHVFENSEDVGRQFTEEARRIHYGEAAHRAIRGQATLQQTRDLLDEGISVMPLPVPAGFTGNLQ